MATNGADNNKEKTVLSAEWELLGENDDNEDDNISNDETEDCFQPDPLGKKKRMEIHETCTLKFCLI